MLAWQVHSKKSCMLHLDVIPNPGVSCVVTSACKSSASCWLHAFQLPVLAPNPACWRAVR